jgi:hypothetical protein
MFHGHFEKARPTTIYCGTIVNAMPTKTANMGG